VVIFKLPPVIPKLPTTPVPLVTLPIVNAPVPVPTLVAAAPVALILVVPNTVVTPVRLIGPGVTVSEEKVPDPPPDSKSNQVAEPEATDANT
jgi:hypothetical protein